MEKRGEVPFRYGPAAFAVLWMLACIAIWYGNRDNWLGGKEVVVPMFCLGVGGYLALLLPSLGLSWKVLSRESVAVIACSLTCFSLLWLFGRRGSYPFELPYPLGGIEHLYTFFYFAASCVVLRMLVPMLLSHFYLNKNPRDYGYSWGGKSRFIWIYVVLFVGAIPMVWWASKQPAFVAKYPLCRNAIEGGMLSIQVFVMYQLAYGLVFVSGESFWRGYMLFGTGRQLGRNALIIMLIPYVIAHFGKPPVETVGAMGAGLLLGYLAWEHRSFWLGVFVHWGVGLMMDCLALVERNVQWTLEW